MSETGKREKDLTLVEDFEYVRAVTADGNSVRVPKSLFGGNLEIANENVLGGIKASEKSETDTQEVKIDPNTGKLYCPPSEVSMATSDKIGGIVADVRTSEYTEEVKIDNSSGKAYVKPSSNLEVATSDKLGGIKAEPKTEAYTVEAKIDEETGKLYVPEGEGTPPDDEDLTITTLDGEKVLQFKDKQYDSDSFSGLGRTYLRKNMVNGVNILTQNLFSNANTRYIIQYDYDLNGATITIPEGCVLDFQGGSLSNGSLSGSYTQIIYGDKAIFKGIAIEGTWNIPVIRSSMFSDIENQDMICELFALTSDDVQNTVILEYGLTCIVSAKYNSVKGKYIGILLNSNTEFVLNGTITLLPNDLTNYEIVYLGSLENVIISGHGSIIGDLSTHTGTSGEWGMGVSIVGSKNVDIRGISIEYCWGDLIYIGGNSSDINISRCTLRRGRRQGISVVYGSLINIEYCRIYDIYGIDPQAAIDLEPNSGETVENVTFIHNYAENCRVAFNIYGYYSTVKNVVVDDYTFKSVDSATTVKVFNYLYKAENVCFRRCYYSDDYENTNYVVVNGFTACKNVTVEQSTFELSGLKLFVYGDNSEDILIANNRVSAPSASILGLVSDIRMEDNIFNAKHFYHYTTTNFTPKAYFKRNTINVSNAITMKGIEDCIFDMNEINAPSACSFTVVGSMSLNGNKISNGVKVNGVNVILSQNHIIVPEGIDFSVTLTDGTVYGNTIEYNNNTNCTFNLTNSQLLRNKISSLGVVLISSDSDGRNTVAENEFSYIGTENINYVVSLSSKDTLFGFNVLKTNDVTSRAISITGSGCRYIGNTIEGTVTSSDPIYIYGNIYVDVAAYRRVGANADIPSFDDEKLFISTKGFMFFDTSYATPVWWDGYNWRTADGCVFKRATSGNTASRPASSYVKVGAFYYDTTIGKPIWYKGSSVWVDATGAEV